jgi:hypothetical protein
VGRTSPPPASAARRLLAGVRSPPPAPLLAAGALALWLALALRTPDLAAQTYRAQLFEHHGLVVWDARWYGGHDMPAYSLLFPPLARLLGLRVTGALAALASVLLFERLAVPAYGRGARAGAALFAIAAVGDVWSGRLTFALGVSLGLAAALALSRARRIVLVAALGALCAAASPVAGLLLALAGLTYALGRRRAAGLALALAPALVVGALVALFPEGGVEPYPILSFAATVAVTGAFLLALPRGARLLRVGALLYLASCVLSLLVPTAMGSNVERYGVLLAGPLLACVLIGRPRLRPVGAIALALAALWIVWGPARETLAVAGDASTGAAYYSPVERFLAAAGGPVRVEVPLTRSHWEAALLAPSVSLARGWEKQLDTRYDGVLLAGALTAASYERWLRAEAVSYVALPDARLDPSSAREGALIRGGLAGLREVFHSRHWRVYAVRSPAPLASGPGRLERLGHESFTLAASAAGIFLVRVHYTRYLAARAGSACVRAGPAGWTTVRVMRPGRVVVAARFSLARALGWGGSCGGGA